MGLFFNPGNRNFEIQKTENYIDKSEMISSINSTLFKENRFSCVSRPRRFGKTYATAMLVAYYDKSCDSSDLFQDLKISEASDYEIHRNKYNIMYLDMTYFMSQCKNRKKLIEYTTEALMKELDRMYPGVIQEDMSLPGAMASIVDHDGASYIAVIDEWDAPIRDAGATEEIKYGYLEFLRGFFKNTAITNKVFAGAYMTGILPIKKNGSQSAVSEFREYTIINPKQFAPFIGFTEEEVKDICRKKDMDFSEMKRWYDGYSLKNAGEIYNAGSVMQAVSYRSYESYWQNSSAADSLIGYLNMDFDGLGADVDDLINGKPITVNTTLFRNDMAELYSRDDVITLLIHFGYLAYDPEDGSAHVPNLEIRQEYDNAIRRITHRETMRRVKDSDALFEATENMDYDTVAHMIQEIHNRECSPRHYNREDSLRSVIKLAYYTYRDYYTQLEEVGGGNGFADMVFVPRRAARRSILIIELKKDDTPENAIAQIIDRGYALPYVEREEDILLIGITYDSKDPAKKHQCRIEEFRR